MAETSDFQEKKTGLVKQLIAINCIKFGQFKLKCGASSNYYIDLRESSMYPTTFRLIVDLVCGIIRGEEKVDGGETPVAIVGVPYGVVPIASAVAYESRLSYYPLRKEVKEYGHKPDSNSFGEYKFILIEDVMSSGSSIIETIRKLEGKTITDVIVIVNRKQGGDERLSKEYPNIKLHSIVDASEILRFNENSINVSL